MSESKPKTNLPKTAALAGVAVSSLVLPAALPVQSEAATPAISPAAAIVAETAIMYGPAEPADVYGPAEPPSSPIDPLTGVPDDDDDDPSGRMTTLYGVQPAPEAPNPWIPVGAGGIAGAITAAVIAIGGGFKKR